MATTKSIPPKDIALRSEGPSDLAAPPTDPAIARIKKHYSCLPPSIDVTSPNAVAYITPPDQPAHRELMWLR